MTRFLPVLLVLVACAPKQPLRELGTPDVPPRLISCDWQDSQRHTQTQSRISVRTEFIVERDGKVNPGTVRIVETGRRIGQERAGYTALPQAQQTAATCTFEPAQLAGEPVAARYRMTFGVTPGG